MCSRGASPDPQGCRPGDACAAAGGPGVDRSVVGREAEVDARAWRGSSQRLVTTLPRVKKCTPSMPWAWVSPNSDDFQPPKE